MSRLNANPDYRQGNAASGGSGDDVMVTSGFKSSVTAKGGRKVLYDSPDSRLGDNYTPHQYFLDAIERNKNLHKYSLSECLVGSCQARDQTNLLLIYIFRVVVWATFRVTESLDSGRIEFLAHLDFFLQNLEFSRKIPPFLLFFEKNYVC